MHKGDNMSIHQRIDDYPILLKEAKIKLLTVDLEIEMLEKQKEKMLEFDDNDDEEKARLEDEASSLLAQLKQLQGKIAVEYKQRNPKAVAYTIEAAVNADEEVMKLREKHSLAQRKANEYVGNVDTDEIDEQIISKRREKIQAEASYESIIAKLECLKLLVQLESIK